MRKLDSKNSLNIFWEHQMSNTLQIPLSNPTINELRHFINQRGFLGDGAEFKPIHIWDPRILPDINIVAIPHTLTKTF